MNRRIHSKFSLSGSGIELLEGRQLLSGSSIPGLAEPVVALPAVAIRDLGSVSASAAVSGVQATANIPATSSVTFQFAIQLGGEYRLLVRHTGNDLSLVANTPAGTATIDAGQAGPFHQIILDLEPGEYQITATANGPEPVFVDWELILYNGVTQSASLAIALGSVPNAAADYGPVPGSMGTTSATADPVTLSAATTSSSGLYLTLESNPIGNPLPAGQSAGLANSISSLQFDGVPADTPAILAGNLAATLSDRPVVSTLNVSKAKVPITTSKSTSGDMDEQSIRALAWLNGLVRRMSLDSMIGQRTAYEPVAVVAAADDAGEPAFLEATSNDAAQARSIDRPALAPALVVGLAVVAVKYGRSIPKRSRKLPSILRFLPAKAPAPPKSSPHAREPWYVRHSQWSTPRSILAQFGRSSGSDETQTWGAESTV